MDVLVRITVGLAACMAMVVAAMADPTGTASESAAVRAAAPEPRRAGAGHAVAGHAIPGHAVAGHAVSEHAVAGHAVAGHAEAGHAIAGHAVSEHAVAGHAEAGHAEAGHAEAGHAEAGHAEAGHAEAGHAEAGHAEAGHAEVGHLEAGHAEVGHLEGGHAASEHAMAGHAVAGHAVGNVGVVLAAGHGADAAAAGQEPWAWPTGSRVVIRPWEAPVDDYSAGHRGIDVPASIGTPVVAVADGTVSFAGPVAGRSVVSVDHGGGLISTVDSVSPEVSRGDTVSQGDVVGRVAVGHCPATDPCVHLGARLDGRYVDPTAYLPAAAWPVLLPESAWPG